MNSKGQIVRVKMNSTESLMADVDFFDTSNGPVPEL